MKVLSLIFLFLLAGLAGCDQKTQEKTDFELGYELGRKEAIKQFWEMLGNETELWQDWEIEAETAKIRGERAEFFGYVMSFIGVAILAFSGWQTERDRNRLKSEKSDVEKQINIAKTQHDQLKAEIEKSAQLIAERQQIENRIAEMRKSEQQIKQRIENLKVEKEKAERKYAEILRKIDEISI
jgi:6-pyruvoyl-tetrahydropterin synthase